MKILYCNPIFFEYRLPFYKELVRLFKGQFFLCIQLIAIPFAEKVNFASK